MSAPYQGSLPVRDGALYGPQPATTSIPFWDVPVPGSPPAPGNKWYPLDPGPGIFSPWDTVLLAGQRLPGRCVVKTRKHKRIDIKKIKGASPATMTLMGYDPSEIDITVYVWTLEQFSALDQVIPILIPPPGKQRQATRSDALSITHPSLMLLRIRSVIVQSVEALEPASPKGVYSMKIRCLEFVPTTGAKEVSTPTGAASFSVAAAIPNPFNPLNPLASVPSPAATDTGPTRTPYQLPFLPAF